MYLVLFTGINQGSENVRAKSGKFRTAIPQLLDQQAFHPLHSIQWFQTIYSEELGWTYCNTII